MSEGRTQQTEEEIRQRNAALRQRRKLSNERRRKKRIRQILALALVAVLAVLAVRFVPALVRRGRSNQEKSEGEPWANAETAEVDASKVLHLSFPTLWTPESAEGADEETPEEGEPAGENGEGEEEPTTISAEVPAQAGALTVRQFQNILKELYEDDYILVNFYGLAEVDETGIARGTVTVPTGKKPLVISQCNIRYGEGGDGYPVTLRQTATGELANEFIRSDGTGAVGPYDLVPVVEEFLERYPDFSYQGARGVLALSGEGGTFGMDPATGEFSMLVTKLRSLGWHFASNGYAGVSYGSAADIVRADASEWQNEIGRRLGTTDILIFPTDADIGRWSGYSEDNEKFKTLEGLGFRYYCIDDNENYTWMQVQPNYLRQGIHVIDTYAEFESVLRSGK